MAGWLDGWMDGLLDGWMDGWIVGSFRREGLGIFLLVDKMKWSDERKKGGGR